MHCLKDNYAYLLSLALRVNPFDPEANPVVGGAQPPAASPRGLDAQAFGLLQGRGRTAKAPVKRNYPFDALWIK